MTWKEKIVSFVADSTLTSALLALMVVGTMCFLYATCKPVPGELLALVGICLGWFSRGKVQQVAQSMRSKGR